jgi:hypothetical protein
MKTQKAAATATATKKARKGTTKKAPAKKGALTAKEDRRMKAVSFCHLSIDPETVGKVAKLAYQVEVMPTDDSAEALACAVLERALDAAIESCSVIDSFHHRDTRFRVVEEGRTMISVDETVGRLLREFCDAAEIDLGAWLDDVLGSFVRQAVTWSTLDTPKGPIFEGILSDFYNGWEIQPRKWKEAFPKFAEIIERERAAGTFAEEGGLTE